MGECEVRFGIYINGYRDRAGAATLREAEEQTLLAEAAGFDWAVLGERHLHRPGHLDVLTTATWLAARTSRIGIATAGIVLPFYQPYFLSQALANVDAASGGRLSAGFVLGYRQDEFTAMGVPFAERVSRFETNLETLQRLWAGETLTVPHGAADEDGAEVFVSPLPVQGPRPPIWNGGRVRAALRRTAESCDAWTTSFNEDKDSLATAIDYYRSLPAGPRSLGRSVIVCRDGFCAATSQRARATLEKPLLTLNSEYARWKQGSVDADRYATLEWDAVAPRVVVGSPAEVVEELAAYRDLGADDVILRVQPPQLAHEDAMRCIELLGSEVIPLLQTSASASSQGTAPGLVAVGATTSRGVPA